LQAGQLKVSGVCERFVNAVWGELEMTWTEIDAVELIRRMYPLSTATVEDGCDEHVVGAVEDLGGNSLASFRLMYHPRSSVREIPIINEIQIGAVGQFCDSVDEFREFEKSHETTKQPGISQADGSRAFVPLSITRFDSGAPVLIWGYVEDYEVCIPSEMCRRGIDAWLGSER